LITLFAVMIIPDDVRKNYVDNLIGGLANNLAGPPLLRLGFHIFVVVVGVLLEWFRKPHVRFGTTFRIINLVTGLQLITIVLSRGDVYLLGEAYAFGV